VARLGQARSGQVVEPGCVQGLHNVRVRRYRCSNGCVRPGQVVSPQLTRQTCSNGCGLGCG
jgi:hypothetical protein